ncbi:hypothetical protein PR048_004778 [Dryococelus australis]|uniref:Uncharacterized protein n=1 Tax=Dryococelus australis TaxID=614101 RepID=A0ABQ9I6D9_9NEOP|nr:hypothetical protein PR048_004778 [Dryococelus australis]
MGAWHPPNYVSSLGFGIKFKVTMFLMDYIEVQQLALHDILLLSYEVEGSGKERKGKENKGLAVERRCGEIWTALNIEILTVGKYGAVQGWGKREVPEKTRRPAASSSTIAIYENSGATLSGVEPSSLRTRRLVMGSQRDRSTSSLVCERHLPSEMRGRIWSRQVTQTAAPHGAGNRPSPAPSHHHISRRREVSATLAVGFMTT